MLYVYKGSDDLYQRISGALRDVDLLVCSVVASSFGRLRRYRGPAPSTRPEKRP
jgi:hypothetical protein